MTKNQNIDLKNWNKEHQDEFLANAYLEIGDTYKIEVENPMSLSPTIRDIEEEFVGLCLNSQYLNFSVKHILNMDLFPYQMAWLHSLWHNRMPLLVAARGGAKTTMLGLYFTLRAVLDQGIKIVVAGAGLRQSGLVFDVMQQIFANSPVLRDICGGLENGPKRTVMGYEWKIGRSIIIGIPIGTGEKVRGLRANIIGVDEFGSANPEIFEMVLRGFAAVRSQNTFDVVRDAYSSKLLSNAGIDLSEFDEYNDSESFGLSGNQIILSGTATYQFNHFYQYYKRYCDIIYNRGVLDGGNVIVKDWKEYVVIRVPHNQLPLGLMDETILEQGAAIMDSSIFMSEYGAVFVKDSEGFFPASTIHRATCPVSFSDGIVTFRPAMSGSSDEFVMGIDPASERDNLVISINRLCEGHREHCYTWAANRKTFEADKKNYKKDYENIRDYNTFIVKKIHYLCNAFNIVRLHLDAGGGGVSIIEGLKDPTKLEKGQYCLYDMDDPEVAGERGRHIIKLIHFSNREWYETAHYNLLKDLTTQTYLFPEDDPIGIEKSIMFSGKSSLLSDRVDDIYGNIEECKYQTILIEEQTTVKGFKKWDLPKPKGNVTEKIQMKLKRDHFTSTLLVNDAARDYLKDEGIVMETVGGIAVKGSVRRKSADDMKYIIKGNKMNRSDFNRTSPIRVISKKDGGSIAF